MKVQTLVLGTMIFAASCNTQPKNANSSSDSTKLSADTTGLAAFQAMKAQNELGEQNNTGNKEEKPAGTVSKSSTHHASQTTNSGNNSTAATGSTQKKGWSKTAKGAVIGGVVGAGTGAVINKKNRAAGAVIGGVIGAGTGAVIGNKMDKKDGRH